MPCTSTILTARIAKGILQIYACHVPQRKHRHQRMTKLRRIFGHCEAWLILPFLTDLLMAQNTEKENLQKSSEIFQYMPTKKLSSKWEENSENTKNKEYGSQNLPNKSPHLVVARIWDHPNNFTVHHFAPALLPIPHLRKKATESVASLCASCSPYLPLQHWPPWPPSCYPPGEFGGEDLAFMQPYHQREISFK